MAKICPRYKYCPKKFSARCGCSVVHKWNCEEDECDHYLKLKIVCREATPEEVMLSDF
jgi:hypothetical protein